MNLESKFKITFSDIRARQGVRAKLNYYNQPTRGEKEGLAAKLGQDCADALCGHRHGLLGANIHWWLESDPDACGRLNIPVAASLLGHWEHNSPDYGFSDDTHFLIFDRHVDDAMAFLIRDDDSGAQVGFASAGNEDDRVMLGSAAEYVDQACDARFVQYWPQPTQRLANGKTPTEVREQLLTLPYDKRDCVTVDELVPLEGEQTVAWWFCQLGGKEQGQLVELLDLPSSGPQETGRLLAQKLYGKGRKSWKKIATALNLHCYGKAAEIKDCLNFKEPHVGLRLSIDAEGAYFRDYACSMLLDITGSEALAEELGDFAAARFDPSFRYSSAVLPFHYQQLNSKSVSIVIPARLLPTAAAQGQSWQSFLQPWARPSD